MSVLARKAEFQRKPPLLLREATQSPQPPINPVGGGGARREIGSFLYSCIKRGEKEGLCYLYK